MARRVQPRRATLLWRHAAPEMVSRRTAEAQAQVDYEREYLPTEAVALFFEGGQWVWPGLSTGYVRRLQGEGAGGGRAGAARWSCTRCH